MYKRAAVLLICLLLPLLLTGCWSSKEIEDLAIYTGLALDVGEPAPVEKDFEAQGAVYSKQDKVMATVQIVPVQAMGLKDTSQSNNMPSDPYHNISGTGDSILEIFRQFSLRLDRPIIGHHLKVIVISTHLLQHYGIEQLTDFVLRDNDIRPSTMVFISEGSARDTLGNSNPNEVPSLHIAGMLRNRQRTSKVLGAVTLAKLDALTHAHRSFVLQNLVTGGKEVEFSGAGIIKGDDGRWIGALDEEDTECLEWLRNEGTSGVIKIEKDWDGEPLTYEIKEMTSKITSKADGGQISFEVAVSSKGRLIETWNKGSTPTSHALAAKIEQMVRKRLEQMMQALMRKLQTEYKADVAGFGDKLAIQHPAAWRGVKEHWDEVFSRSKVTIKYDVKITDFGSFTE